MDGVTVGVRQLKERLSEYLRLVKRGRTLVVTERGVPVARIVPVAMPLGDRMQAMLDAGLAEWNGKPLPPASPVARLKQGKSIADLILEDRR